MFQDDDDEEDEKEEDMAEQPLRLIMFLSLLHCNRSRIELYPNGPFWVGE